MTYFTPLLRTLAHISMLYYIHYIIYIIYTCVILNLISNRLLPNHINKLKISLVKLVIENHFFLCNLI